MARWLTILVITGLVAGLVGIAGAPAEAQVFKPKGKKSDAAEKRSEKKAPAKKKAAAKKKGSTKARKAAVADRDRDRDRSDEDDSEPASKADSDYVKITDDDEIE